MLVINIYYTGKNGSAKLFAKEMVNSGIVDNIRNENGNLGYNYFFSKDDLKPYYLLTNGKTKPHLTIIINLLIWKLLQSSGKNMVFICALKNLVQLMIM